MTESYRCWAEVDLHALRNNLIRIRTLAGPGKKILAVVKADAYGHGLRQIAAVLMEGGTDIFGVANLAEACAIHSVGKGWPILMLGACLPAEVDLAVREGVMPTISTRDEARRYSDAAVQQNQNLSVHIKVDTGMGRLGVNPNEALALIKAIESLPGLTLQGVYTHYSSVEDDAKFTARQRLQFDTVVAACSGRGKRPCLLHASNSGGLLLEQNEPCGLVRTGLLVYGVIPNGSRLAHAPVFSQFRPALSWKCRVSLVKPVPAGTPISYGHTFTASCALRIAIITAGYGDGYFRAASNRAQVLIGGKRCAVLGRVTMDQTIVDVSGVGSVACGDEVVLIGEQGGEQITAVELADWCHTIPWEVLTNISYRVPRIYRGHHAA